jgi:hypothetical protein
MSGYLVGDLVLGPLYLYFRNNPALILSKFRWHDRVPHLHWW